MHLVDDGVDTGPVLAQARCGRPGDTVETLHERIKIEERRLLVGTVAALARHGATVTGREVTSREGRRREPSGAGAPGADQRLRQGGPGWSWPPGCTRSASRSSRPGRRRQRIADAGVPVTPVEELTGFPECLDGRVKTLHPRVHAGLLADTRRPEHLAQLAELGIAPFELLVANLYPFTETVASGAAPDECVEQIDIGGPAMVRAAAKNHDSVAVVVDPDALRLGARAGRGRRLRARRPAAARRRGVPAHRHLRRRGRLLAGQRARARPATARSPAWVGATWDRAATLRYGENPHQAAALYVAGRPRARRRRAAARQGDVVQQLRRRRRRLAGRARPRRRRASRSIKHANPCGIAVGADVAEAHRKAHATDPVSAFGGVIAANREVSVAMAEQVAEVFTEVVMAPVLRPKAPWRCSPARRTCGCCAAGPGRARRVPRCAPISGGLLLQHRDAIDAPGDDPASWTLAAGEPVPDDVLADLAFAWRACRSVKSNAILLAAGGAAVGVGMGQVNRVDAARLAVARAGERARGAVAASDAFFPFPDGLQVLLDAGVRAVVQPGGSVRDAEVIAAAAAAGVPLYLTGTRHFAH